MKKLHRQEIDIPFEVGQTYTTKFATGERFTITKIIMCTDKKKHGDISHFLGIYEKAPHLGECPLGADRLIQRKEFTGVEFEVTQCPKCKHEFKD